jgi:hypothetical protein
MDQPRDDDIDLLYEGHWLRLVRARSESRRHRQ